MTAKAQKIHTIKGTQKVGIYGFTPKYHCVDMAGRTKGMTGKINSVKLIKREGKFFLP